MPVPFSVEQFLDVFERFNLAVRPVLPGAWVLGAAAVALAWRGGRTAGRFVAAALSLLWVFTGAVYHLAFFREINPAATLFGALFLFQGALLALAGTRGALRFGPDRPPLTMLGLCLIVYAAVAYPAVGSLAGHAFPRAPSFGVTPCPLVVFTFGLLLLAQASVPAWLLVVPALWSAIGTSAALRFGMVEDFGLGIAGVVGTAGILLRNRRLRAQREARAPVVELPPTRRSA